MTLSSIGAASRWLRPLVVSTVLVAGVTMSSTVAKADLSVRIVDAPRAVQQWGFGPKSVHVESGSWVVWSNEGKDTHSATATDGSFDSGPLQPSEGFSWYFDHVGTYDYVCSLHPWMKGRVVVGDGDPAQAIDSAPSDPAEESSE